MIAAEKIYRRGAVKIACVFISPAPFHLYRFLDEQMFRFNTRKDMNVGQRFQLAMSQIAGKQLTYDELRGKSDSPHHEERGTRETPLPFSSLSDFFGFRKDKAVVS